MDIFLAIAANALTAKPDKRFATAPAPHWAVRAARAVARSLRRRKARKTR